MLEMKVVKKCLHIVTSCVVKTYKIEGKIN